MEKESVWNAVGASEVVIDSAADESVCPRERAKGFQTKPVPESKKMSFRNASGGKMEHYGAKKVFASSRA